MGDEPNDEPRPEDRTEREVSTDRHSDDSDHESSGDDESSRGDPEARDAEIDGDDEAADETDADGDNEAADETDADGDNEAADETDADGDNEAADETDADGDDGTEEEAESEGDGQPAVDEEDRSEHEEGDDGDETDGDADEEGDDADEADGDAVEVDADGESSALERKTGPQTDEEQPLADHIEEMIKRLGIVIAIAGVVSLAAFPFAEEAITFLWYSILPADISQPHVYHPLELVLTQLKTASLLGLVIALPAFVYETYAFMRPGLYPHERRYYLAAVPTSLILALVGISFAYFIVLPAVMNYFLYYSDQVVDIAFALGQTFNLFLILMGYLAIVFQIPLFIMLAIMMGLTTREWMEDRRLIFWGVFLGISFLFSPDPTGMAPIIVAATMVALFEGTLLLLRWTQRG
jgi:sec-independent protein translocase protein TatC